MKHHLPFDALVSFETCVGGAVVLLFLVVLLVSALFATMPASYFGVTFGGLSLLFS